MSSGSASATCNAQQLDNHLGKVVRVNKDRKVPADNPFTQTPGALPEIYRSAMQPWFQCVRQPTPAIGG